MPKVQSQLYRWSFTVQASGESPLPPRQSIVDLLRSWGAKKWIYQHEKVLRDHWQGSVQLANKKRKSWLLNNLGGLTKEWVTVSPTASKTGAFDYCMKSDSRVAGPWSDVPIYMGSDLMKQPRPWQQSILDSVKAEPDDRTINWVYEPRGNVGKSKLVKYMEYNKLAEEIPQGTATQIKTYVIAVGPARCYLVDIPRSVGKDEREVNLFSALESVKNGSVKSAMYGKVQRLFMNPPHVWCFANHKPSYELVSRDRWKVWTITHDSKLVASN